MIYKTTLNNGLKACVTIIREGSENTFFALVVDENNESTYAIGQMDKTDGYYNMTFLRESCLYDIFTGAIDWHSDEVWMSRTYTYSDMENGFMIKISDE